MPTRFYLPDTDGTPGSITPAFGSMWDTGSGTAKRRTMSTSKTGTASGGVDGQVNETAATTPEDCLVFQYVSSQQIANAGFIEPGTFSCVIGINTNLTMPGFLQLTVRIISADGSTERGTLVAGATQTTTSATVGDQNQAVTTSTRNTRIWNAIAYSGMVVQAGDRLVLEIGIRSCNTSTSIRTASLTSGDSTTDKALTANVTATGSADAYWCELSSDVLAPTPIAPPDPPAPPTPEEANGYVLEATTGSWSLDADTNDPDSFTGRSLLDGALFSWATELLPPVLTPAGCTFQVYDDGTNPSGWIPITLGEPVHVTLDAYLSDGSTTQRLVTFEGRIADVSAVNHPRGGVVFTVICVDRLTDLANQRFTNTLDGGSTIFAYMQVVDDSGIDFDWNAGTTQTVVPVATQDMDTTNSNTLDVLNNVVAHDWRVGADGQQVSRYLTLLIDDGVATPQQAAVYRLVQYDPTEPAGLDHLFTLYFDDPVWIAQLTPDYDDTYGGMVVDASQMALDVGEWRQTRPQAINRVDISGSFDTGAERVRTQFGALVKAYGANTRSLTSPLELASDAALVGVALLGDLSQVQDGYGFTTGTIVWEQLTDDQRTSWCAELWPHVAFLSEDMWQAAGRPLAITNVPDHWRLADSPVIAGRLLGVNYSMSGGKIRLGMTLRSVPATTTAGITWDGINSLSPEVSYNTLSLDITYDLSTLIHDPLS